MSPLRDEIRQRRPFAGPEEEALLNLLRTAHRVGQVHAHLFKPHRLTPVQYNALRILRGAHPEPLPCSAVGERMVTAVPDVTRLLDRLEAKGLVARCRDDGDRRVVQVALTAEGLTLLASLDEPLAEWLAAAFADLGADELQRLSGLLERVRQSVGRLDPAAAPAPETAPAPAAR